MSPQTSQKDHMDHSSIYKAVKSVSNGARSESSSVNSFINCTNSEITGNAETVCKKFNNLINLLYINRPQTVFLIFPTLNDYKYLSYWLLQEFNINNVKFSDISEKFYNNMKENYNNFFSKETLKSEIANIQHMDFDDMSILDNLYKNYYEIYTIISSGTQNVKGSCNQFSEKCHRYYELGIMKCSDNSSNLYKALQYYKQTYEDSFKLSGIEYICDSIELKELRSYDEIKGKKTTGFNTENDKNNMFTPILLPIIVLLSIFIFFYKFTPLGSWLRNTVNKKKDIKNTINRETHQLLNMDENNNININSGQYNVRYHS